MFESPIVLGQLGKHSDVFDGFIFPVIVIVVLSHLNREPNISDVGKTNSVGVACHHGSPCQMIGHPGTELIDAIAPSRISGEKDFIDINDIV